MMEMKITVEAPDLAASILKLAEAIASGPDPSILTPDEPLPVASYPTAPAPAPAPAPAAPVSPAPVTPTQTPTPAPAAPVIRIGTSSGLAVPYPCACGPCGGPQPRSCADCWPDICRPW